ncbi:MAG: MATE family efflux transporter [Clostridia bacterium]|nr:MATE family efflux transporter [Clostridia bacterium]
MKKRSADLALFSVILSLALPTMLEQAMQTAVQYVDTAMVGSLGTSAVAAVGATTTVNWLVGSSVSALSVGFLAYISRALGAGNEEDARRAAAQSVSVTLLVGALLTAVTLLLAGPIVRWMQVDEAIAPLAARYFFILYSPMLFRVATTVFSTVLRAAGDTKTPMKIALAVNLTNVVLNFLLIYPARTAALFEKTVFLWGAGLGVEGAALASTVSFVLGGTLTAVCLFRHKTVSPRGKSLKPNKSILAPCMRVAIPNMLQRFLTSAGYVVFAALINSTGELSTAAHTVANTVESAFYIPAYGMQTAAATLAGNAYGARDHEKMRRLPRLFLPLEVGLMILSGTLLFLLAPQLAALFSSDKEVVTLAVTVLRMVALSEPFYGVSIIVEGMLLGVGKTGLPAVYNTVGMWGVRILGTFICIRFFALGLVSAWGCMIAHNLLLFCLFTRCYKSGRWNPLAHQ